MQLVEIRANQITVDGYVNATGRFSHPIFSHKKKFIEQIEPGAFTKALKKNPEVRMLFNHDGSKEIGKNGSNVKLYEDSIGLRVHAVITDSEVVEAAKKGELRGWSFGFRKPVDTWEDGEPYDKRSIADMDLTEVSLLTKQPAYIATTVECRGTDEDRTELRMMDDEPEVRCVKEDNNVGNDSKYDHSILQREIEILEKGVL